MFEIKDPIEQHNKKAIRDIDENNNRVKLKAKEDSLREVKSYSQSVFSGRQYFIPSETYRNNYELIFGVKEGI
jgi:hypothetical protein